MENSVVISQKKLNLELPYDPAIPLLYTQKNWKQGLRYLYTNVDSSVIHNRQKLETTQCPSMDEQINKIGIFIQWGVLFGFKKESASYTCYSMGESWGHYVKWNKPDVKGQILYDSTSVRYPE